MYFQNRHFALMNVAVFLLLGSVGCACKYPGAPQPYSIQVTLDSAVQSRKVDVVVDLVAINVAETPAWEDMSVTDYFNPADPKELRKGVVKKTLEFLRGGEAVKTFSPTDPQWNEIWGNWQAGGARNLFVLLDMPEKFDDAKGDLDPRRRMLPLGKCAYDDTVMKNNTLRLSVTPRGLVVETPYKSPDER